MGGSLRVLCDLYLLQEHLHCFRRFLEIPSLFFIELELYLAVENIDHSKTKARSPQSNGVCKRFHKTVLDEFYRVAFRKKVYTSLDEPTPTKFSA